MDKITSSSPIQTQLIAAEFVKGLKSGTTVALIGELGAGKTTFVQGVGEALGLSRLISPTYVLMRQYEVDHQVIKTLYHIDLYRLSSPQEALDLGLTEIFGQPQNLILIEWPKLILPYFPNDHYQIHLEKQSSDHRLITINHVQ